MLPNRNRNCMGRCGCPVVIYYERRMLLFTTDSRKAVADLCSSSDSMRVNSIGQMCVIGLMIYQSMLVGRYYMLLTTV